MVVFIDEDEVNVVPNIWLTDGDTKCYWPPYRDSKLSKAIKARWPSQEQWPLYAVRVLSKHDDYSEAQRASRRAEKYSDVQSEGEYGRGCRRVEKRRLDSDSDSGSSASTLELPPKKKLLPAPPDLTCNPRLQRANAIVKRPTQVEVNAASTSDTRRHLDDTSGSLEKSKDMTTILRAVARCETAVEDMHKKIDDVLSKKLDDILHKLNSIKNREAQSKSEDLPAIKPDLPVRTMEEFEQLNENLDADPSLERAMHCRLRRLGGTNVKTSVKYIVDTILTNELQTKFNWEGRIDWKTKNNECKMGFKKSKICSIVKKVMLDSTNFTTTEDEIGKTIMIYLRNSADRCGGRRRRTHELQQSDDSLSTS